jgi:hypothetical protein
MWEDWVSEMEGWVSSRDWELDVYELKICELIGWRDKGLLSEEEYLDKVDEVVGYEVR